MKQKFAYSLLLTVLFLSPLKGFAGPQNDVVGYWTHNFRPGFNLAAFPVLPDTPTPQAVIGDRLGAVEISTWDDALDGWRYTKYDPASGSWNGNLFLLSRGVAYWINLLNADEPRRLMIVGHPELYTKFRWDRLLLGRQFYAPTYGKSQALSDLPPDEARDLLIGWDAEHRQFQLAEPGAQGWRSPYFERLEPDRAYIVFLHHQPPRQLGPPLEIQIQYERVNAKLISNERDGIDENEFTTPPQPLIVGNIDGLPVCNPNGEVCGAELSVAIYRERIVRDEQGNDVPTAEQVAQQRVLPNPALAGRFRLAIAVGNSDGTVQPGDRVYLIARDGNGAETRSTSFEVPSDDREVIDLSFNDPLNAGGIKAEAPIEFALGEPYPNPFNDRFSIDVRIPETASVEIALYDIQGRLASKHSQPLSAGAHRLTIQGGNLAAGIYLMKVNANGKQGLVKIAHLK